MSLPPVFLDRDGTLIVEREYLRDPAGVMLEATVTDGLSLLSGQGFPLVVLSNQSGIGRGMLTLEDARRVNERVDALLKAHGINISGWYICPHAPGTECACRKPLPGMARTAASDLGLSLPGCFVVGDKRTDLELADALAGTGILMTTGHGREHSRWAQENARPAFDRFKDAASYIVDRLH